MLGVGFPCLYQPIWEVVGHVVCELIQKAWPNDMLKVYKCITEVTVTRVKPLLDGTISPCQASFI
ncbi:hypothetical protein Lal_00000850 [Lupinus albus]|nr:hypothetical protein Lal_00000850 [Lupinus albus]